MSIYHKFFIVQSNFIPSPLTIMTATNTKKKEWKASPEDRYDASLSDMQNLDCTKTEIQKAYARSEEIYKELGNVEEKKTALKKELKDLKIKASYHYWYKINPKHKEKLKASPKRPKKDPSSKIEKQKKTGKTVTITFEK
jgi:hypothetical protein